MSGLTVENISLYETSIFHQIDIISIIYKYLNYIDSLQLLSITKYIYNNSSRIRYLKLNREGSKKYYETIEFRNYIKTLICNTKKQLYINLYDFSYIKDVTVLKDIHSINLRYCTLVEDVSALQNSTDLILDHTHIKCVDDLKDVTSLSLRFCHQLINVNALTKLYYLDLSYCNISDVSALGNVHTLILKGCENITNVTDLINNYILDISGCINITNINTLKNVYNLNISGCEGIRNVDMLTNVSILNMNNCYNIKNVSNLTHLDVLYIHPSPVNGIKLLKNVHIIYDY